VKRDFDLVIVGGGMVGAALACLLARTQLRIAVVESRRHDFTWPREGYDNRVSAITRATENAFRAMGAWKGMLARRVQPYKQMHVWDATGGGAIHFDAAEVREHNLGYIIENEVILAALRERMAQLPNVRLVAPARVRELQLTPAGATLLLDDAPALTAELVVGADGSRSWVREQAGIGTWGWSYEQTAVVATVKTERHHDDACRQRFAPEGPLAFLPLPEGYSSIVWSTTPERADGLMALSADAFLAELQLAFGDGLGRMEWCGPRGAFPLGLQHATGYVRERLALIGNAAHTIHPLAGQGLNIGVADAAALAQVIEERGGEPVGSFRLLRRYERWRKGHNLAVMFSMDGFKRLFGSGFPPVALARNWGLSLTDKASPIKNLLVRHALGDTRDLPRACLAATRRG
jgi:2-octaprenylphenol hydroxylase